MVSGSISDHNVQNSFGECYASLLRVRVSVSGQPVGWFAVQQNAVCKRLAEQLPVVFPLPGRANVVALVLL